MKICLDIDGVLVDNNHKQMPYLKEFVKAIFDLTKGGVYWLSTHSKHGDNAIALKYCRY